MVERTGKVQTVRGLIDPGSMGVTLMHEHLLIDMRCRYSPGPEASRQAFGEAPVTAERRADLTLDETANRDNLVLLDEPLAIAEAMRFKSGGGGTIVDTTTLGLGRDPAALRRISTATGLHVSMGAGYYVYLCHPPDMDTRSEESLRDEMVRDVEVGVGDSGIKCGHIGEIGCERQTPNEMKVVRAAAQAQRATGAMLNIHQMYGYSGLTAHTIVDAIEASGGDLSRTVLSHMDTSEIDLDYQVSLLQRGVTLEYDCFGYESYDMRADSQSPTDGQRIQALRRLADGGWLAQLVIAQDICLKTMLRAYGGWGYGHIVERVLPRFRRRGFSDAEIAAILVDNPRRLLAFAPPAG